MALVTVVNYYVLGPLPIALPLLLPVLAVAGGTLEGAPFGAVYGGICGAVMSGLGHLSPACIITPVRLRLDRRADHPIRPPPGRVGPPDLLGVRHPAVGAVGSGPPPARPRRPAGGAAGGGGPGAFVDPCAGLAGVLGGPFLLRELREDLP